MHVITFSHCNLKCVSNLTARLTSIYHTLLRIRFSLCFLGAVNNHKPKNTTQGAAFPRREANGSPEGGFAVAILAVECCHPDGAAWGGHAGHVIPLPRLWVPALHCVQVTPAIVPSNCIHGSFQHCHSWRNGIRDKLARGFPDRRRIHPVR